jgi:hypothetical protein
MRRVEESRSRGGVEVKSPELYFNRISLLSFDEVARANMNWPILYTDFLFVRSLVPMKYLLELSYTIGLHAGTIRSDLPNAFAKLSWIACTCSGRCGVWGSDLEYL